MNENFELVGISFLMQNLESHKHTKFKKKIPNNSDWKTNFIVTNKCKNFRQWFISVGKRNKQFDGGLTYLIT